MITSVGVALGGIGVTICPREGGGGVFVIAGNGVIVGVAVGCANGRLHALNRKKPSEITVVIFEY